MSPVASDAGYPAVWGGKVIQEGGLEPPESRMRRDRPRTGTHRHLLE